MPALREVRRAEERPLPGLWGSAMVRVALACLLLAGCIKTPTQQIKDCQVERAAQAGAFGQSRENIDREIDVLLADSDCSAITPAVLRRVLHDMNRRQP
jgi:hypothetical protein